MFVIPGQQKSKDLCDAHLGPTRRELMRVGGSAMMGLTLVKSCSCKIARQKRPRQNQAVQDLARPSA